MDCEQNMLVDCVPHTTNECYNEATQIVFIFEIETKTAYHQWECFQAQKGTKYGVFVSSKDSPEGPPLGHHFTSNRRRLMANC